MDKSTVMKNYRFLALMLFAMVAGCVAGWFFPEFGHFIKPAGTVFINMMFCVVVPLVFASISNSVASVRSRKRAGKIMGTTVLTFVVTGAVAAVIMFIVMKLVPPVLEPWTDMATEAIGEHASLADMIVNFFTTDDFVGLLMHAEHLEATFGVGPHTISVPRICPADDIDTADFPNSISDEIFRRIVAVIRIAVPYTGMIISTRESQESRRQVLDIGISQRRFANQRRRLCRTGAIIGKLCSV